MGTDSLEVLTQKVIACRLCPRLVEYLRSIQKENPDYWCHPVPGWGDPEAPLLLLGLAPGRRGSNRTGRVFTGDHSGVWLYRALHELGLSNQPQSVAATDGLRLKRVYVTAIVRCAPPGNKPLPSEIANCNPFLRRELSLLKDVRVVVALGRVAHDTFLKTIGLQPRSFAFSHGRGHRLPGGQTLLDSYHPSRRNTQTGKMTWGMWVGVLRKARDVARRASREPVPD